MRDTQGRKWEVLHGPHKADICAEFDTEYQRIHGPTQKSLRLFVQNAVDTYSYLGGSYLTAMTPEALAFIAQHGQDYTPQEFSKKMPEPRPRRCHVNAWEWMRVANQPVPKCKLVYVEGVAYGVYVPPMLHAWNARGLQTVEARDWTFYSRTKWIKYFGIPFTQEEYSRCCRILGRRPDPYPQLLFEGDNFKRLAPTLTRILTHRKPGPLS